MKRILAYLILSIFTLINLQQLVLIGSYLLTQEYITQKFCVNKDKPELKCNGKCHLKDVLSKSTTTEEDKSHLSVEILFSIFYFDFQDEVIIKTPFAKVYNTFNKKLFANFNQFFFHPPPFLSFT